MLHTKRVVQFSIQTLTFAFAFYTVTYSHSRKPATLRWRTLFIFPIGLARLCAEVAAELRHDPKQAA